jgi:hypothetical protein
MKKNILVFISLLIFSQTTLAYDHVRANPDFNSDYDLTRGQQINLSIFKLAKNHNPITNPMFLVDPRSTLVVKADNLPCGLSYYDQIALFTPERSRFTIVGFPSANCNLHHFPITITATDSGHEVAKQTVYLTTKNGQPRFRDPGEISAKHSEGINIHDLIIDPTGDDQDIMIWLDPDTQLPDGVTFKFGIFKSTEPVRGWFKFYAKNKNGATTAQSVYIRLN